MIVIHIWIYPMMYDSITKSGCESETIRLKKVYSVVCIKTWQYRKLPLKAIYPSYIKFSRLIKYVSHTYIHWRDVCIHTHKIFNSGKSKCSPFVCISTFHIYYVGAPNIYQWIYVSLSAKDLLTRFVQARKYIFFIFPWAIIQSWKFVCTT